MIEVTWEWLGQGLALDLADTVTIENGDEHDLIATQPDYARWAEIEAGFLERGDAKLLEVARPKLLVLRAAVRDALAAVSVGKAVPRGAVDALNRASRAAPTWLELDAGDHTLRTQTSGRPVAALVASYARATMKLLDHERDRVRRCPAPSCGMFYVSRRPQQTWCSTQCGTRARVARHYRTRHPKARS